MGGLVCLAGKDEVLIGLFYGPVPYTEPWLDVVLDRVLHALGLK